MALSRAARRRRLAEDTARMIRWAEAHSGPSSQHADVITEHDTGLGSDRWYEYPIVDGDVTATAYAAVRRRHKFLTADNHLWERSEGVTAGWFSIVIRRNAKSPEPMPLGGYLPSWVERGPGSHWFTVKFYLGARKEVRGV